jgi:endonuclease-3 related protein
MPSWTGSFPELLAALAGRYGAAPPPAPDDEPFVSILRAFLEQTHGAARGRAILSALRDAGLLDPADLSAADPVEVGDVLAGCGVTNPAKAAASLRRLVRWVTGRLDTIESAPTESLREELRGLRGIGPATADAILLGGLGRPAYPIDRGTYRILVRHGWIDTTAGYDEARSLVEQPAADDSPALRALSHGLGRVAVEFCRPTVPRCERCPLRAFLPANGPIAGE